VVAVELTDQSARTIQKSYALVARDKCWLAYVASEPTPARLQMVDGRLLERQPATARRTFPGGASTDGVVDFEFSPDGRLLAYRFGSDAGSLRLGLVRLSDGQEQLQDLGGSVTAYAWAPDAQSLAVAFTANNQDLLGGVDVSAVDRTRVAPGGRLEGTRRLASRVVPSIDSTLVGYAGDRLAFLSRDVGSLRRRLRTTARDATGFAPTAPPPPGDFSDAARLLASAGGVFVTEPETASLAFFPSDGRPPVLHGAGAVPSPAGSFVGVARDAALQLFRAFDASAPPAPPVLAASGCTAVLAWASERERIACVAERDGSSPIAVFDVRAGGSRLAPLTPTAESLVFSVGAHEGHRRVMSARGGWLGVTSDAELIISQLDTDAARLWAVLPTTALGTRPGALLFSPDEAALLIGAGNSLTLLDLEDAARPWAVLSNSALVEDACSERFADGAEAWCGSALQGPVLAWSSASDLVSFRSALGTLSVIDVSLVRQGVVGPTLSPDGDCSEACRSSQTARFQP
jgi:WD40 repeat protein